MSTSAHLVCCLEHLALAIRQSIQNNQVELDLLTTIPAIEMTAVFYIFTVHENEASMKNKVVLNETLVDWGEHNHY